MDTFEPGQDSAPDVDTTVDSGSVENSQETQAPQAPATEEQHFSGHPAWKPFEEALGPIHYRSIEPHLRSMNQAFESKIAAANKSLEPWKAFIDEGVTPDELQFTRQLANEINSNPLSFYQKLEGYLRQTGQIEAANAVAEKVDELEGAEGADLDEDPRIAQLQQKIAELEGLATQTQQSQLQWLQQQQQEQAVAREFSQLENEVKALQSQGADKSAIKQVLDRAELAHLRGEKRRPLADIYQDVVNEFQIIRNQPQAVDRAPRLPGVTGGAPSQGSTDLSTASRSQSIDTLAALIQSAKG